MEVRSGEAGDGSVRAELQGWEPDRNQRSDQDWGVMWKTQDGGDCPNMQEGLSAPIPNDS